MSSPMERRRKYSSALPATPHHTTSVGDTPPPERKNDKENSGRRGAIHVLGLAALVVFALRGSHVGSISELRGSTSRQVSMQTTETETSTPEAALEVVEASPCNISGLWTAKTSLEKEVATALSPPPPECPKCDRLELPFGRYFWNEKESRAVHVPPSDSSSICGPRILIVGAMKCGTNTLGSLLLNHPRVKVNGCAGSQSPLCDSDHFTADSAMNGPPAVWEIHGLSHDYKNDPLNWEGKYAQRFPHTDGFNGVGEMTFDKSPSYFNTEIFPGIAARAKRLLPNAKVVVSVCNPTERLFSEYMHYQHDGFGGRVGEEKFYTDAGVAAPSNFSAFVDMLKPESDLSKQNPIRWEAMRRNKLRTGEYHTHLKAWRDEFGAENVLVVTMDESNIDKARKMVKLAGGCLPEEEYPWSALNETAASFANTHYAGRSAGHSEHEAAMRWLADHFEPHNQALAVEVGADWPLAWNNWPEHNQ